VEGKIAPGSKLNERELAESLNVSRTPIREAIRRLAADGLVELIANRGAIAVQLSIDDVIHTIEPPATGKSDLDEATFLKSFFTILADTIHYYPAMINYEIMLANKYYFAYVQNLAIPKENHNIMGYGDFGLCTAQMKIYFDAGQVPEGFDEEKFYTISDTVTKLNYSSEEYPDQENFYVYTKNTGVIGFATSALQLLRGAS
jgi:hypothetical protein